MDIDYTITLGVYVECKITGEMPKTTKLIPACTNRECACYQVELCKDAVFCTQCGEQVDSITIEYLPEYPNIMPAKMDFIGRYDEYRHYDLWIYLGTCIGRFNHIVPITVTQSPKNEIAKFKKTRPYKTLVDYYGAKNIKVKFGLVNRV